LACQHHLYVTIGVLASRNLNRKNSEKDCLLIGLGAGGLPTYLSKYLKLKTTVVEIDEAIYEVAKKFYELCENGNLKVVIDDGLRFLKGSDERQKFKSIVFDVDSKDSSVGISCPPAAFLEPEILESLKKVLDENGVFILNLVCRDENLRTTIIATLKEKFASVYSFKLDEDVNEIFYCFHKECDGFLKCLKDASLEFNEFSKKNKQDNKIDVVELFETIKLN
jgi:spermidine synthase